MNVFPCSNQPIASLEYASTGMQIQDKMIHAKIAALVTFSVSILSRIYVVKVLHKEYFRFEDCSLTRQDENTAGKTFMNTLFMSL